MAVCKDEVDRLLAVDAAAIGNFSDVGSVDSGGNIGFLLLPPSLLSVRLVEGNLFRGSEKQHR